MIILVHRNVVYNIFVLVCVSNEIQVQHEANRAGGVFLRELPAAHIICFCTGKQKNCRNNIPFTDFYRLLPETLRGFPWCRQCSFEHASQGQTATWRWLRSRASWFARGGLWWPVARFGRHCVVGMNYSSATFTDHRYMMFINFLYVYASGVENRASSRARFWKHAYAPSRLGLCVCVLTFMLTCCTCTCYVTSGVRGGF